MANLSLERLLFDSANPSDGPSLGSYIIGKGGLVVTSTTDGGDELLDVRVAQIDGIAVVAEDSAVAGGADVLLQGAYRQDSLATDTSADGDASFIKVNAKGEQYVIDTDGNALLTTIDADTGAILTDTNAMVVDLAAIEVLLTSIDSDTGNILSDTNALVVDVAAIEVLLTQIDADTSSIATDASTIAGDTTSIDAAIAALSIAEDSVSVGGEKGIQMLAVRNDTEGSLVSADGDFGALQLDGSGRLRVIADIDVTGDLPNVAINNAAISVGLTQVALPASPLANRTRIQIQNNGDKPLFIGKTGVTTANGIEVDKGATISLEAGPNLAFFGISTAAAQDIRIMELS